MNLKENGKNDERFRRRQQFRSRLTPFGIFFGDPVAPRALGFTKHRVVEIFD